MDLLEGTTSRPDIPGSTAEEQLTHVLGALWVVQHMKATDDSIADALREFAKRVRNSTERT